DAAGAERFRSITNSYYNGADGIILSYDISDKESFKKLNEWIANIILYVSKEVVVALVGNKSDKDERKVTFKEGKDLAKKYNALFFETSAKLNDSVNGMVSSLTSELFRNEERKKVDDVGK